MICKSFLPSSLPIIVYMLHLLIYHTGPKPTSKNSPANRSQLSIKTAFYYGQGKDHNWGHVFFHPKGSLDFHNSRFFGLLVIENLLGTLSSLVVIHHVRIYIDRESSGIHSVWKVCVS